MIKATWALVALAFLQFLALCAQAFYVARTIVHSWLVERAYISGGGVRERLKTDKSGVFCDTGRFQFHVNNYGKTPGRLLRIGFSFCEANNIPSQPKYQSQPFLVPLNPTLRSLPIWTETIPPELDDPVVYGRFYYETVFETRHASGFIYHIRADTLSSMPVADAPAAYTEDRDGDT